MDMPHPPYAVSIESVKQRSVQLINTLAFFDAPASNVHKTLTARTLVGVSLEYVLLNWVRVNHVMRIVIVWETDAISTGAPMNVD
jgi:hypothetical protein